MDQLYTIIVKPQQYAVAVAVIAAGVDMFKQLAPAFLVVAAGADQVHKGVGAAVMQEGVVIVEEDGITVEIHAHAILGFPRKPDLFAVGDVFQPEFRVSILLVFEVVHEVTEVLQVQPGHIIYAVDKAQVQRIRYVRFAKVGLRQLLLDVVIGRLVHPAILRHGAAHEQQHCSQEN